MRALATLLLAAVALAGCGGEDETTPLTTATVEAAESVEDLDSVDALRSDFERHACKTRVVLLFAPT